MTTDAERRWKRRMRLTRRVTTPPALWFVAVTPMTWLVRTMLIVVVVLDEVRDWFDEKVERSGIHEARGRLRALLTQENEA